MDQLYGADAYRHRCKMGRMVQGGAGAVLVGGGGEGEGSTGEARRSGAVDGSAAEGFGDGRSGEGDCGGAMPVPYGGARAGGGVVPPSGALAGALARS